MDQHVRNVGWILIVLGAVFGLISIGVLVAMGGYEGILLFNDPFFKRRDIASIPLDRLLLAVAVTFWLVIAGPMILVGRGILEWKPWARVAGLFVGAVSLLNVPLGTGVGLYAIWVLNDESAEFLFQHQPSSGPKR